MDKLNPIGSGNFTEINLKHFLQKIYKRKFLFLFSLGLCLGLAYAFLKIATPIYQVQSTLLIDTDDLSQMQESNKYLEGGIHMAEKEKNIFNEIGILKSYKLIEQTLQELDVKLAYFSGKWPVLREQSGAFPFKVILENSLAQLPNTKFKVEPITGERFRLTVKAKKPSVYKPDMQGWLEIDQPLEHSGIYKFGEEITHEYFNFRLEKEEESTLLANFQDQELFFESRRVEDLAKAYLSSIEVSQVDLQSSIIQIQTKGTVAEKEIEFINRLTRNYIQNKLNKRIDIVSGKESFIKDQLAAITDSLSRAERSLEVFKQGANAVDLQKTAAISLDKLQALESEKGQIELNIDYYFSLLKYLGEGSNFDKIMAPSVVGINDPLLNENLVELKRLNSEHTRLEFYKGKESYDLEILNKQIKNTAISLQENLKNLMASAKMALKDKKRRIAKLEHTLDGLPSSEKQLVNFERKSGLYENLYNYLNQELAKTEIASSKQISDTQVLDEARIVGDGPIFPQSILILALAFILGLLFPIAWMVLADAFNEQIDTKKNLESSTTIPVIASIAHLPKRSLLFGDRAKWSVEESFRDLGANLNFMVPDPSKKVIGFTSFNAGEGKTFCSINLAISLATAGKKILLIDTDLRKPSLLGGNDRVPGGGLSNYLKGEVQNVEDIIKSHPSIANLHYIPTEKELSNPQEFLLDKKMEQLLKAASYEYDYIIIDSPAVGLVSDYLLVSKLIDIHLFVLRRNQSKTSFIRELEKLKLKGEMEHVFFLFNGVNRSYYKYGYGYTKKDKEDTEAMVVRSLN